MYSLNYADSTFITFLEAIIFHIVCIDYLGF